MSELRSRTAGSSPSTDPRQDDAEQVTFSLTREQAWIVYDLLTAKAERIAVAEYEAMQGLGGSALYEAQKVIRRALGEVSR